MAYLSVIVPIYNESKSIPILFDTLENAVGQYDYEIIAVNDGSKDDSLDQLRIVCARNKRVKAVNFKRNFGQTAAINAGIQHASGEVIVLIDSDLENDPNDISKLVDRLDDGYDVVSGWRQNRWKGEFLTRKLPSMTANKLISSISGVPLHDYGCTLKAYRRDVIKDVTLYGQMHRFIPVYCAWQGGKVTEMPVNYQPRQFGKSNYGIFRTYKVVLDLVLIKFLEKYMQRPIHFFGGAGILAFLVTFVATIMAAYFKLTGQKDLVETPLPTIASMFFVVGIQLVLMGVIAEILMRTYYESQNKMPYSVKELINFDVPDGTANQAETVQAERLRVR
ncbi:glycosyltransferase family 2 protein [Fibrella forsythiae]|uniref:Glycosyltransferase family 2 protein n=1 Tax=Fibrella forsythiae TaxID=2817061 RepID=A0ABS3JH52_9BACT|nr:glycosyltransferase family 2 protein [Fibrella forsythiae]MBO0949341.1 glycosyltransferase family 2 protein [Fibrella forsythiae]